MKTFQQLTNFLASYGCRIFVKQYPHCILARVCRHGKTLGFVCNGSIQSFWIGSETREQMYKNIMEFLPGKTLVSDEFAIKIPELESE